MTPRLVENIRCHLWEIALESLVISDCQCEENEPLDLSGALGSNWSLKGFELQ
jgi:hypothetical protein